MVYYLINACHLGMIIFSLGRFPTKFSALSWKTSTFQRTFYMLELHLLKKPSMTTLQTSVRRTYVQLGI